MSENNSKNFSRFKVLIMLAMSAATAFCAIFAIRELLSGVAAIRKNICCTKAGIS